MHICMTVLLELELKSCLDLIYYCEFANISYLESSYSYIGMSCRGHVDSCKPLTGFQRKCGRARSVNVI